MSAPDLWGIYGASGCGRGIMPLARRLLARQGVPLDRLCFIDDGNQTGEVNGQRCLTFDRFVDQAAGRPFHIAIAIADGRIRHKLYEKCHAAGGRIWSVSADNCEIFDDVEIGEGALLSPFVTITSNIRIGRCFHGNLYSYVEHDCMVGDFVTFAPGAKCNGNVEIGDFAYIGSGAVLKQGKPGAPLKIGAGAVVGMGAIVTRDVPPGAIVVGNPARILIKG